MDPDPDNSTLDQTCTVLPRSAPNLARSHRVRPCRVTQR